jgi:ATP-dependent helicase/nuclease subunit A
VLACRYAHLIIEGECTVDQILALTFTNKAVAEMYRRIYGILSEIARTADEPYRARAQKAISEFFRARIQTLDSYSGAVVRQAANRYGIRPDFVTDGARCKEIAQTEALPFILSRRNHPVVRELFKLTDAETLAGTLFAGTALSCASLENPPDFAEEARLQAAIIVDEWQSLEARVCDILNSFDNAFDSECTPAFAKAAAPFAEAIRGGAVHGTLHVPTAPEVRAFFDAVLACTAEGKVATALAHSVRVQMLALASFFLRF